MINELNLPSVRSVRDVMSASQATEGSPGLTTGDYRLDLFTGGIRPGSSWLFGAATSWGKSSWLVAVADENIRAGKRVLIVSSEDTGELYGDRLLVRRTGVSAMRFRDGALHAHERELVASEVDRAGAEPFFVDARRYPVEALAEHLPALIREHRVDLVAFDYVQEFRTRRRFQDERVKFREIASVLRGITKGTGVAGIIMSQLTTDKETKIPTHLNIRESRDMAHAADVILIGFSPDTDVSDLVAAGSKCVLVDKVKSGKRGAKIELQWDEQTASFRTTGAPDSAFLDEDFDT